jgi:hypothetical protein
VNPEVRPLGRVVGHREIGRNAEGVHIRVVGSRSILVAQRLPMCKLRANHALFVEISGRANHDRLRTVPDNPTNGESYATFSILLA